MDFVDDVTAMLPDWLPTDKLYVERVVPHLLMFGQIGCSLYPNLQIQTDIRGQTDRQTCMRGKVDEKRLLVSPSTVPPDPDSCHVSHVLSAGHGNINININANAALKRGDVTQREGRKGEREEGVEIGMGKDGRREEK
ncbi:hypothetical protein C0Q70_11069 [Pomacea canaliculata]|uniref:Uncharacterized protein n=1 Tax=Pomacea canaliculata TaxID=400727 RepID=A0A2T7P4Z4_POMCA|nr:hypothetical protein C0Q70_11069 [Pomacea canaliculata]